MECKLLIVETLRVYGIGRRKLDDELFSDDKPPPRLGTYDEDDETLCHEIIKSSCHIPGCAFTTYSLLDFENHYNAAHRYTCAECKRILLSPHLLDLHVQETHDSFFAVMADRKPSYCCYIEECKDKFQNAEERFDHCLKIHKLPKDFRFDRKPNVPRKPKKKNVQKTKTKDNENMELDVNNKKEFTFTNNKQKSFSKYCGRQFTKDEPRSVQGVSQDVNMDDIVQDLKKSLPEG